MDQIYLYFYKTKIYRYFNNIGGLQILIICYIRNLRNFESKPIINRNINLISSSITEWICRIVFRFFRLTPFLKQFPRLLFRVVKLFVYKQNRAKTMFCIKKSQNVSAVFLRDAPQF